MTWALSTELTRRLSEARQQLSAELETLRERQYDRPEESRSVEVRDWLIEMEHLEEILMDGPVTARRNRTYAPPPDPR